MTNKDKELNSNSNGENQTKSGIYCLHTDIYHLYYINTICYRP